MGSGIHVESLLLVECKEKRLDGRHTQQQGAGYDAQCGAEAAADHAGQPVQIPFHPDGVILLPKMGTLRLKGIEPKTEKAVTLTFDQVAANRLHGFQLVG